MTWSAKVTIEGTDYLYDDGANAGPHLAGYKVYFRPDEIIFHWGTARDKSVAPRNLPPYTAEAFKDGVSVQKYTIGNDKNLHWWASRWLHEITPDKIIRTPKDLIEGFLAPPFGDMGITPDPISSPVFEGPMGTAGLVTYEPTTGERSEIGIETDWGAHFLRTGEASGMIETGKAAFSMPMFWTDERTGKPWDLIKEPSANTYWTPVQGSPWMGPWAPASVPPNPWTLDGAHGMEDEGLIYFATGLDRHLEALQYRAIAMFLEDAYTSGKAGYAVCAPAQTRKTAWTIRQLAMACKATEMREAQGNFPDYLLPSATLKQMLDNQFDWFRKSYTTVSALQTFHVWPDYRAAFWQQDYLNTAFALPAMWWPDKYADVYLWTLYSTIQRTNGKSGWPPAFPTVYYIGLFVDSPMNTVWLDSWADAWKKFVADQLAGTDPQGNNGQVTQAIADALAKDPYNGGVYAYTGVDYPLNVRGVLAFAVWLDRNKIVNVSATYPELEQCYAVQDAMAKRRNYMTERWSLAVDPQPVTVITIEPSNPATTEPGGDAPSTLPVPIAADPSIFDKVAALNLETDQNAVLVDLTGKIPSGTGKLLFNLQGNGETRVTVIWPGPQANWIKPGTDTAKGGKSWSEQHATGNSFVLYNCGTSLIVNDTQIGTPQADPPSTQTEPPPMSVSINVGQTNTMTLSAIDPSGNVIPSPVFDSAPVWSADNSDVTLGPTADGLSCIAHAVAAGTSTVTVTAVSNGKSFSATNVMTIAVPPPQIDHLQITDSVA